MIPASAWTLKRRLFLTSVWSSVIFNEPLPSTWTRPFSRTILRSPSRRLIGSKIPHLYMRPQNGAMSLLLTPIIIYIIFPALVCDFSQCMGKSVVCSICIILTNKLCSESHSTFLKKLFVCLLHLYFFIDYNRPFGR